MAYNALSMNLQLFVGTVAKVFEIERHQPA